jgi:hypothetical protein
VTIRSGDETRQNGSCGPETGRYSLCEEAHGRGAQFIGDTVPLLMAIKIWRRKNMFPCLPLHWQGSTHILFFLLFWRYQHFQAYINPVLPTKEQSKSSVAVEWNIHLRLKGRRHCSYWFRTTCSVETIRDHIFSSTFALLGEKIYLSGYLIKVLCPYLICIAERRVLSKSEKFSSHHQQYFGSVL